jgi:TolB-like protein
MNFPTLSIANPLFSDDAITDQLEKIFIHPDFNKSEILKRFLSYIVHETITGNANYLKEYTIALNVLEKPPSFNPQQDCIVRIHAVRLRQALSNYYFGMGADDELIIGIPKGKYVPVFMNRQQWLSEKRMLSQTQEIKQRASGNEPLTFAILPFICVTKGKLVKAFNDSLCLQMCSTLSQNDQFSVIAYQAIVNLVTKHMDFKELGSIVGFNHIITGGTQFIKDKLRINIQIINSSTYKQIWSKSFECKITPHSNFFDIQDDICEQTIIQAINLANKT